MTNAQTREGGVWERLFVGMAKIDTRGSVREITKEFKQIVLARFTSIGNVIVQSNKMIQILKIKSWAENIYDFTLRYFSPYIFIALTRWITRESLSKSSLSP